MSWLQKVNEYTELDNFLKVPSLSSRFHKGLAADSIFVKITLSLYYLSHALQLKTL